MEMKLYDQNQMTGYSLTHPRGWKHSMMGAYYESTKYRNLSYVNMDAHKSLNYNPLVPTFGNRTHVCVGSKANAIDEAQGNSLEYKRLFLIDDYYNLKDRNFITVEVRLYIPSFCDSRDDIIRIGYHLNGKGRLWCIERDLEVKL